MIDPCEQTQMDSFSLSRPLSSKKGKEDQYVIPGPFDVVDLSTAEDGLHKCGPVTCEAFMADHETQPDFLTVNNRIFDTQTETYNTQLVLKPIEDRDETGQFNIFLDCTFAEYADLGVFTQQINVEILEPSQCNAAEGGTNDSDCEDEEGRRLMSDDDFDFGVSADDSSNDGYSGNDMGSSDSSGDGPSIDSDNAGRRHLETENTFAMTNPEPVVRMNHRGEPARFHNNV